MQRIVVDHRGGGWRVCGGPLDAPLFFDTGAQAEATARRLAAELAEDGWDVALDVYLMDGSLAGRFSWPARVALAA